MKNRMTYLAVHFWRPSLGVLYAFEKAMYVRECSRRAGSRVRGEGRERDTLQVIIFITPVAHGLVGFYSLREIVSSHQRVARFLHH